MRQTRFFSPAELERTTVLSRALDLSLSLSADFIATFFFVPRRRGLVVFFFGCILSFCAVACSRTCFAGKHKRAVVHHNFRPNGKRGISLRELSSSRLVVHCRRKKRLIRTFFLSLRSFSRSLFDARRRRRRRRHRFETRPLCVVKAKKKALTKTLDVPLLLRTTNPLYIG